ncbi:hypothetical protein [Desulfosarcina ovata]|uniref:Uncharacterized protein n=1 Tax=Desulfosarcina ovata subsp. ovata TaxID=2752305 RepID=A0A5K8AM85_9BACT|nr:hypothetical protein [Desulfosarcina ovata]BBO92734.1 hypothetical protein DSCOOX_59140 [Desulfosarcina ovata subsp. ovata]
MIPNRGFVPCVTLVDGQQHTHSSQQGRLDTNGWRQQREKPLGSVAFCFQGLTPYAFFPERASFG